MYLIFSFCFIICSLGKNKYVCWHWTIAICACTVHVSTHDAFCNSCFAIILEYYCLRGSVEKWFLLTSLLFKFMHLALPHYMVDLFEPEKFVELTLGDILVVLHLIFWRGNSMAHPDTCRTWLWRLQNVFHFSLFSAVHGFVPMMVL